MSNDNYYGNYKQRDFYHQIRCRIGTSSNKNYFSAEEVKIIIDKLSAYEVMKRPLDVTRVEDLLPRIPKWEYQNVKNTHPTMNNLATILEALILASSNKLDKFLKSQAQNLDNSPAEIDEDKCIVIEKDKITNVLLEFKEMCDANSEFAKRITYLSINEETDEEAVIEMRIRK